MQFFYHSLVQLVRTDEAFEVQPLNSTLEIIAFILFYSSLF